MTTWLKSTVPPLLSVVLMGGLCVSRPARADDPTTLPPATVPHRGYELPAHAKKITDSLYYLGSAKDPRSGRQVRGYVFIHHAAAYLKRGGGGAGNGEPKCYSFVSLDAKWKSVPEPWVVNPANPNSVLSDSFILSNISENMDKWEAAASADVLGDGTLTTADLSVGANTPNGANEVYFDSLGNRRIVAQTFLWGVFDGPNYLREIYEWDQIFNTQQKWSGEHSVVSDSMDFENISTHELGHSFGMGDIYYDVCSEQTMFGYTSTGETKKRSLEAKDIAGINWLY